jgi:putative thioredoxin
MEPMQPFSLAAKPAKAQDQSLVKDVDLNSFMTEVIEASLQSLVIVHFWSPRSVACKQLSPILEKLVSAYKGGVRLVRVDGDTNPEIAEQFRIQTVPTVFAILRGQPVDGFQGARTETQVKQWLERLTKSTGLDAALAGPPDLTEALQQAEQALAAGDWQMAQDIFSDLLGLEPELAAAYGGLARAMIGGGHLDQAREFLSKAPAAIAKDKALAAAHAALELAELAKQAGPLQELEQRLAKDPADHAVRYDLALALLAAQRREEAVEHLLEIVRRQRNWNEEAARKQLVKLFEAFGPTDPITVQGRKKLSSILFA